MEEGIKIAIYVHAFFGGLGLITGIGSVMVKKGSKNHKKLGKLFSIGMVTSSLISMPISWMPNHESLFLFLMGLFTIYLVVSGNRGLTFKSKDNADWIDKAISGSMLLAAAVMIFIGTYGIFNNVSNSILYLIFGGVGFLLSFRDFQFFKNFKTQKNSWLANHAGKMIGALIASVTAFITAGLGYSTLISWTLPSIIGTVYIIYWIRKVKE